MPPLSRFQTELLQFFQSFFEEEGRPPRLLEIALPFGLSEDSARIHICVLQKGGFLLPCATDIAFLRVLGPWTHFDSVTGIPLFGTIPAGAPEDCSQENRTFIPIPLERLGITPSEDIFALEVRGDSMSGKHIIEGDIVLLNRPKRPMHGNVVAALVDNQTTLKTYFEKGGKKFLRAENPAYKDIIPTEELQIQGVMIYLLRRTPS